MGKLEPAYFNFVYHPLKEEDGDISGIMVVATEVTETVKAKHLLQEREKHFRSLVILSPIPMTILRGRDFIIETANKVMLDEIWRKTEVEVIGHSLIEVFPELKEQKYPELLAKVFTSGKSHSEKESVAIIQGNEGIKKFYLDFEYSPLFEPDGKVSGIMVTVNDVTDKVEARKKVEEAEERSRLAAEATELATWALDLETREMIHSPRMAEIYGHDSYKKLTHPQIRSQILEDDRVNIVEKAFEKALSTGVYFFEARLARTDNSIRWIRTHGKTFYNEKKEPVKLVGTLRDVTEEKQLQQVLQESEAKFRLLADSLPQQVWIADPQGHINYYNQAVYKYSGLSQDQLNRDGWIQLVHPDEREENTKAWKHSVSTGKDFLFEHRFRRHDGEYRWQLSRAIAQRDHDGKIQMWVGASTDIQDQKVFASELEKQVWERTSELKQKNLDLEKMNKELQSFAYISSHDLQEPLRKIQTFASQIQENESQNLSEFVKDKFHRMQNAAKRMQTLIEDLLAYSRTNNDDKKFEWVSLQNIMNTVQENLREELENKKAILETGLMCSMKIIPFQFHQLLYNLVNNSLKFSGQNKTPHIKITCEEGSGKKFSNVKLNPEKLYSHIQLSDNGIGFEQQYNEKIFELFQRLHSKEKYNGTGIGLAIVKKIVENHDGVITASGQLGIGATFDIYIPVD